MQIMQFQALRGSLSWFKLVILSETNEGHHKLSFETIFIKVLSIWGFPDEKKCGQSRAKLTPKNWFEILTGFAYLCKMIVLIQTFEGHQKIIFEIDSLF